VDIVEIFARVNGLSILYPDGKPFLGFEQRVVGFLMF
jgi:hypothetical protein